MRHLALLGRARYKMLWKGQLTPPQHLVVLAVLALLSVPILPPDLGCHHVHHHAAHALARFCVGA